MKDLISRQDAIDAVANGLKHVFVEYQDVAEKLLNNVPSAQPEQSSEIKDILEYLDTVLHPIISPDHWNVYSELHDMISMLPSAQPYTEEEIQAMQDLEQAQLDKAYQIGVEEGLQSAQPEQIARDIATIIENEKDMRVILQNAERTETHECDYQRTETHDSRREWYMKGYRDAQPKWTPVSSESMPEDGVTVWVTIKGHDVIRCEDGETLEQAVARISKMRRVSEGFWCEDDKTWYNAGGYPMMVQPVAWMPMEVPEPAWMPMEVPEPYKGGESDA